MQLACIFSLFCNRPNWIELSTVDKFLISKISKNQQNETKRSKSRKFNLQVGEGCMRYSGFRAIVIKDDKIALIERWKNGLHFFVLPGGRLEIGESAEQCVIREIKEELNINIRPKKLVYDLIDYRAQGIFCAEWLSGEVGKTDAEEYRNDRVGGDYEPVLKSLSELKKLNLLPKELKMQLLKDLENGATFEGEKVVIRSNFSR